MSSFMNLRDGEIYCGEVPRFRNWPQGHETTTKFSTDVETFSGLAITLKHSIPKLAVFVKSESAIDRNRVRCYRSFLACAAGLTW